jgi:hypothetical protein
MAGPLVFASTAALRDADRMLPGRVLENAVTDAINHGRKRPFAPPGVDIPELGRDDRFVIVTSRVGAIVVRDHRPSGRKMWLIRRLVTLQSPRKRTSPLG